MGKESHLGLLSKNKLTKEVAMSCVPSTLSVNKTGAFMNQNRTILNRLQTLSPGDGRLVSAQTGTLLVGIGNLLMNLYPFREHVDPHTGEMLVKIGRKLTGE